MLILQNITYLHPDKEQLFHNISFTVNAHEKVALVGNNGTGKSTLLKMMAGILQPSGGVVQTAAKPYYVTQLTDQFNHLTVAQALQAADKLKALHEIVEGNVTETNLSVLNDDWTIEERIKEALLYWGLEDIPADRKMGTLSGGQKTKVFLAGILIHQPEIVLLDEPSNHLDTASRIKLYDFVSSASCTMVIVSHDRTLLNLPGKVYELSKHGIAMYGGNYDFYATQKQVENNALNQDLKSKEKALRKAKETERETAERQQKLDARGRKKQEKAGLPTISMNTFRNNAEKSTARTKNVHAEKVGGIAQELNELRKELPFPDKMKLGFDNSVLHRGKVLFEAKGVNVSYGNKILWQQALNIRINSGERIALKGGNGTGKTTLIKMILGTMEPVTGTVHRAIQKPVYIDQDYSLINPMCTVFEQASAFNFLALQEHEIKIRLTHFLFTKDYWNKKCDTLSGGERMRLVLCCLTIGNVEPDMIVLDEPTNNLDILNTEILTAAINDYKGTLVVVSHDGYFLQQVNTVRVIDLD